MSREVIINADDFGMSEAFNHGVIKGYLVWSCIVYYYND